MQIFHQKCNLKISFSDLKLACHKMQRTGGWVSRSQCAVRSFASSTSPGPTASDVCATGLGFQELFKESKEHFTCTNQLCWLWLCLSSLKPKWWSGVYSGSAELSQPECAYIVSSRDQVPSKCQRWKKKMSTRPGGRSTCDAMSNFLVKHSV